MKQTKAPLWIEKQFKRRQGVVNAARMQQPMVYSVLALQENQGSAPWSPLSPLEVSPKTLPPHWGGARVACQRRFWLGD